jgi:hypothetical protein
MTVVSLTAAKFARNLSVFEPGAVSGPVAKYLTGETGDCTGFTGGGFQRFSDRQTGCVFQRRAANVKI